MASHSQEPADPITPADAFLISLWDQLESALEIATSAEVLVRLADVLTHCEAAAAEIRRWQASSV